MVLIKPQKPSLVLALESWHFSQVIYIFGALEKTGFAP